MKTGSIPSFQIEKSEGTENSKELVIVKSMKMRKNNAKILMKNAKNLVKQCVWMINAD